VTQKIPVTPIIRVMLVDDHPLLRAGFSRYLQETDNIEVVAEASSSEEALSVYFEKLPDVLVCDIRLQSSKSGIDVAQSILVKKPNAKIVMLSQSDQHELIKRAYKIGAKSFVTKDSETEELLHAIRRAYDDKVYYPPNIAEQLAHYGTEHSQLEILNDRELAILKLIASGFKNQEISNELNVSLKTVTNNSNNLKKKLGLNRTAELTKFAIKHNLIDLN